MTLVAAAFALSILSTGCREAATAKSTHTQPANVAAVPLHHFWFQYNGQPDPGRRVWMQMDHETWAELYPNGSVSRYRAEGRTIVNGENGTAVRKFKGGEKETLTPNDGSFEVFIPDKTATNRILFFRQSRPDTPSRWVALAPIKTID